MMTRKSHKSNAEKSLVGNLRNAFFLAKNLSKYWKHGNDDNNKNNRNNVAVGVGNEATQEVSKNR